MKTESIIELLKATGDKPAVRVDAPPIRYPRFYWWNDDYDYLQYVDDSGGGFEQAAADTLRQDLSREDSDATLIAYDKVL